MKCKHEGCNNKRKMGEYSCTSCVRVTAIGKLACQVLMKKDIGPGMAWDMAEILYNRSDQERQRFSV